MKFLDIYVNLIRAFLIIAAVYHVFTRKYKPLIAIAGVFSLTFFLVFLEWALKIQMDLLGSVLYYAIICMSIYFGSALKYYDKYAWWDIIIHLLSGVAFISFGLALSSKVADLTKLQALFFSLTLATTLHVFWEIAEYIVDCLFQTNHQRWQKINPAVNHQPKTAIQPAGLVDTMTDTIVCLLAGGIACVGWWFVL